MQEEEHREGSDRGRQEEEEVQDYDSFFQQGGALVNIEQLRGRAVSANLIQSRSARTTSITS